MTENEHDIIGAMLLDGACLDMGLELLTPAMFSHELELVFEAMRTLHTEGKGVDVALVAEQLKKQRQLEKVGGFTMLSGLLMGIITVGNFHYHAELLREKATLQRLKEYAGDLHAVASSPEAESKLVLSDMISKLTDLETTSQKTFDLGEIIAPVLDEALSGNPRKRGVLTGFGELDKYTSGFKKGDVIIIGARPQMGKTAWALQVTEQVAINNRVMFFSLEMPEGQLGDRFAARGANINHQDIQDATYTAKGIERFKDYVENKVNRYRGNICFDTRSALTPLEIHAAARRFQRKGGLDLIIIDYLQLLRIKGRFENMNARVTYVSSRLKEIARRLDVPIIVLSQLNRKVEERAGGRPTLGDLRDSGSIEQDASIVMFLWRPEAYGTSEIKTKHGAELTENKSILIIAKNRHGKTGEIWYNWSGMYQRLTEIDWHHKEESWVK